MPGAQKKWKVRILSSARIPVSMRRVGKEGLWDLA
jgi:hypothetical protein